MEATLNDYKNALFRHCDEYKRTPQCNERFHNFAGGIWFVLQKRKIENGDHNLYLKLSENKYVEEDLDRIFDKSTPFPTETANYQIPTKN